MIANKLSLGDTIGIISPSHIAERDTYEKIISEIEHLGFHVKTGTNLYKSSYGYSASEHERADDLNEMVNDKSVKLIFFGGGYGSVELLPHIDFDNIKKNPKLFLSYSDGTSILNAIYSKTGLITYYGQTPGNYISLDSYTHQQFLSNIVHGDAPNFVSNSKWIRLNGGTCEGILIGGYLLNFAMMINTEYMRINENEKYILFLEDNEKFFGISAVSSFLSHIEQSYVMKNISGLLFGNYSDNVSNDFLSMLKRFGNRNNIPIAYCDDFGHGKNHAIIPIGIKGVLDTEMSSLKFIY